MYISKFKLQGAETVSNSSMVFPIDSRINILYHSEHSTLQRQASNTYNGYV